MKKYFWLNIFLILMLLTTRLIADSNIIILQPKDKSFVYEDSIQVVGVIADDSIQYVRVDGSLVKIENRRFTKKVDLKIGKNIIEFTAQDNSGDLEYTSRRILRKVEFPDLENYFWAKKEIEDLATLGIVSSYYDHTFKPEKPVERAELAATLVKIDKLPLPEVTANIFTDVSSKYWGAPYIKAAVAQGFFTDYPDGTFKPLRNVTRAEAIAILLRFAGIAEPKKISTAPFPDVPVNHWAAKAINKALETGIIKDTLKFKPNEVLTRATLAFIVARLPKIQAMTTTLYDWPSYKKIATPKQVKSTQVKPVIKKVTITPDFIPANQSTIATIKVRLFHQYGLDKIQRVAIDCSVIGWGKDSQLFLYDDGKSSGDEKAHDGIYTSQFIVFDTVKPGPVILPIIVADLNNVTLNSSVGINVVSNINGMY